MKRYDVIIVGTGHGGAQTAIALRKHGFCGTIAMVGKDGLAPYERPPLSKEYLSRDKVFERIMVRPQGFWSERAIDLVLDAEIVSVDAAARTIATCDGRRFEYGDLVWSAGGTPRNFECQGADLGGVHTVRDRADADAIMADLDQGAQRVVVVGGGYIGLEAAAVLTRLGCKVVLLEALDRLLARVSGEELSRFLEAEHRTRGVDIRLGVSVDSLEGEGGRVRAVRLANGEALPCDMVIVGIGIVPVTGPLAAAGARIGNGVEVDAHCRTSLPNVYAIGDCAAHANSFAGGNIVRLESVQNANDMATTAAKAICHIDEPYRATPWFWSNQYDIKLQTVGLAQGYDQTVLRGAPSTRSFSVIYLKQGRVLALDCINATKDYVQGRALVEKNVCAPIEELSDTTNSLKNISKMYGIQ